MEKRILDVKHTKNISYPEARKFIENSLATTTYANIAEPANNFAQNQGMRTHFDIINLIKELKTLLELLKESLTTKPHAGPDPKKNLHSHSNKTEDPKRINQTKTQPKQQQALGIPPITTKTNNLAPNN